ncbi:PhzF family phenazine biosynthesis protein [Afifella sp. IM 167]|uniref:PhzF family phenazine biosynthesis protein n=1 Tax=Afifella sp. IM 167 TaxID=2033586 RepID=UPI001CCC2A35|nr:PhzF family phenazine biosynthesis isomerase [Afifella sp. IM 167]MBZ8134094.1 phenazine biosynthesis protein PhzF [Afifella sp. IM 167]
MPTVSLVRVFPASPKGGNPAPIVLDAECMSADEMREVAKCYGHECGFVVSSTPQGDADFHFRYFVPNHEMEMCGHATIGALWMLREAGRVAKPRVSIKTLSGQVAAVVPPAGPIAVSQPVGRIAELTADQSGLVRSVLGIAEGDLAQPHLLNAATSRVKTLVALNSIEHLHALAPDFDRMQRICDQIGSTGLYPFALDQVSGVAHARQFPKSSGYPEDAATGIAASALVFGMLHWGLANPAETVTVRQGEAMGRASEILVSFERSGSAVTGCWITGSCTVDESEDLESVS